MGTEPVSFAFTGAMGGPGALFVAVIVFTAARYHWLGECAVRVALGLWAVALVTRLYIVARMVVDKVR